ncbi:MAG TPA: (d)CMP kinase [Dehalococcoidia bacterium]|nr:(d)CMP kinase [Dehalococcoidia bacterium]
MSAESAGIVTLSKPRTVAIDGPVASGKSSVGRLLAQRWGHVFLDTGMMYRAMTWWALRHGIAPDDAAALARLASEARITIEPTAEVPRVMIDGEDATPHMRDREVEANVSMVSAVPGVRSALVREQRRIAEQQPVVMAGRDIGTVVLPDADLKVYLDASVETRARRRHGELDRGSRTLEEVREELTARDRLDSERSVSPLRPADDAIILDVDHLGLAEVVERIAAFAGCEGDGTAEATS